MSSERSGGPVWPESEADRPQNASRKREREHARAGPERTKVDQRGRDPRSNPPTRSRPAGTSIASSPDESSRPLWATSIAHQAAVLAEPEHDRKEEAEGSQSRARRALDADARASGDSGRRPGRRFVSSSVAPRACASARVLRHLEGQFAG